MSEHENGVASRNYPALEEFYAARAELRRVRETPVLEEKHSREEGSCES